MSLLLKALRQAEQSHASHTPASGEAGSRAMELELDPLTRPKREWVEPTGHDDFLPRPEKSREWRWPLGLIPTTALLALLVAIGYGFYLYLMTRPQTWTPPPVPDTAPAPAPAEASQPAEEAPELSAPASPPVSVPQTPSVSAESTPMKPEPALPATRESPRLPRQAAAIERKPVAAPATAIVSPAAPTNFLEQGYAAFQSGRLNEARALYEKSASTGPNAQALLGLAAIAQARGETAEAIKLYQSVLDISPRNAIAQAALLDLLGTSDPAAATARLKSLISREPSSFLFFTLGNLYADQGRWSDAELAYFEAFQREPSNADYAFNLAVSLDHLKQADAAVRYYETALNLAGPSTRFDRAQARNRAELLR